ncbi:MAG: DnaD domain protein [Clostridia bacterium]|nr:DnaD domain protein [Clostridia bacterium]
MATLKYRIDRVRVIGSAAFSEASKEELRVLLALIELSGEVESAEELASAAVTSPARCKSALAFWEESGVISADDGQPTITEEFEERLVRGEIDEVPAVRVAESIRDEGLANMIDDVGNIMGQPCLSNTDVKSLTALYTQYSLAPDYISMLAAHLKARGCLTVKRLCDEAIRLCGKGCDSYEALEAYISLVEKTSAAEWEFRRLLGIYNRTLSPSEHRFFKRWSEEFGYSVGIVSLAYDIAVLNTRTGRGDLRYMDSILTSWYEAGCKTVSECQAHIESERARKSAESAARGKKGGKTTPETPRYGNFDINEAFADAVARSFSEDNNDDEGGDQ